MAMETAIEELRSMMGELQQQVRALSVARESENVAAEESLPPGSPIPPGLRESRPGKDKERIPLSRIRNIDKCGVFEGKPLTYLNWESRLLAALNDEPGVKDLIIWAINHETDLTLDDVRKYPKQDALMLDPEVYSAQLYSLLINVTDGTPGLMVDNTIGDNGLQAMRRLHKNYAFVTPQARRKLIHQILHPTQAKTYEEILEMQEIWEKNRSRYEEVTENKLPDDVLVVGYCSLLPHPRCTTTC